MRVHSVRFLLLIAFSASAVAQNTTSASGFSDDPRAMLTAAKPLYAYDDPTLKPWHLSGTYQIFGVAGNPGQQGKYELWWKEPGVYRSSWSRGGSTRTEWHRADGTTVQQSTGDRLFYFEHALAEFLISPIPDVQSLDQRAFEIKRDELYLNKFKMPCAETRPPAQSQVKSSFVNVREKVTYCFDPTMPVLRIERLFEEFVEFNQLAKNQGRVLPHEITVTDQKRKLLSFNVEKIEDLSEAEIVKPPPDAEPAPTPERPISCGGGALIRKVAPTYPIAAKAMGVSGTVTLDVMIGKDGKVSDIRVLSSPSPLLVPASRDVVAQWQYTPCIIGGQPQELNTIINVVFFL